MMKHTHISFELATLAGKPGCYFWEQLGLHGVCMSDSKDKR